MAERLTRTKKYAELRNQIANDREESLGTAELNAYQDKLNNVQSQFIRNENPTFINKPVFDEPKEEKTDVADKIIKAENDSMKSLDEILSSMMNEAYPTETVHNEETLKPVIEEPVQVEEPVKPQINEVPLTNDFVKETLTNVEDYNRKAGNITLEELPGAIVDNVRHGEKPVDNFNNVDDDFSSTVSLEIEKVLAEIQNQNKEQSHDDVPSIEKEAELVNNTNEEVAKFEEQPVVENVQEEIKEEVLIQPESIVIEEPKQETFEHPVLAKTLEQPVVEIKNITETLNMQRANEDVVDDTIPFNANRVYTDSEDDEYEDEEGPSKVLNVILGILIFVLVVVLGIIVYYILVAKGIIG